MGRSSPNSNSRQTDQLSQTFPSPSSRSSPVAVNQNLSRDGSSRSLTPDSMPDGSPTRSSSVSVTISTWGFANGADGNLDCGSREFSSAGSERDGERSTFEFRSSTTRLDGGRPQSRAGSHANRPSSRPSSRQLGLCESGSPRYGLGGSPRRARVGMPGPSSVVQGSPRQGSSPRQRGQHQHGGRTPTPIPGANRRNLRIPELLATMGEQVPRPLD